MDNTPRVEAERKSDKRGSCLGRAVCSSVFTAISCASGILNLIFKILRAIAFPVLAVITGFVAVALIFGLGVYVVGFVSALTEVSEILAGLVFVIFVVAVYLVPVLLLLILSCNELIPPVFGVVGFFTSLATLVGSQSRLKIAQPPKMRKRTKTANVIGWINLVISIVALAVFGLMALVSIGAMLAGVIYLYIVLLG